MHISNGNTGFAGYGPGFWGPGHDPLHTPGAGARRGGYVEGDRNALGASTAQQVNEPAEVIPALQRALCVNTSGSPGLYRVHLPQCNTVPPAPVGLDRARSTKMPKLIPVPDFL